MSRPYPIDATILFYADLHVGDRSNGRRYTDMIEAEHFITKLAVERKVNWVVFLGDAFKSRNPHDEHKTRWVEARIARNSAFGDTIRQIDIVGNHCRWYKAEESGHVFETLAAMGGHPIADTMCTVNNDFRALFHCLPAQTEYREGAWKPDPKKINICLFHGMMKGCSLSKDGSFTASDGIPQEILDRPEFDLVMGGDIHLPQVFDFKNTSGGYVGSTLQLDATDAGEPRGVLIVSFKKGEVKPEIEFVPVPQAELRIVHWDAATPPPDMGPHYGHLVTLKVTNANAISSVDLEAEFGKMRKMVRHLVTSVEHVGAGRVAHAAIEVHNDPILDFEAYLKRLPGLPEVRRDRLIQLIKETLHGRSA